MRVTPGEFAILSSTPTATNQNAWIAFMKEKLKDPKFAKMKLVQIAYGQGEVNRSISSRRWRLFRRSQT